MSDTEDIEDVLSFDPFAKEAETPTKTPAEPAASTPTEPTVTPTEMGVTPPVEKPPAPGGEEQKAPAPPTEDPIVALLKRQNDDLAKQVGTLTQTLSGLQTEVRRPREGQPPQLPEYTVNIPDQLLEMLSSEDRNHQRQALTAIVRATAQTVHQRVMGEVERRIKEDVPSMMQSHTSEAQMADEVNRDFYAKFPDLNNPSVKLITANEALALARETGGSNWTPQFRDALGARVRQILQGFRQPAAGEPNQPKPPVQIGGNARGGAAPNRSDPNSSKDIMETLFG